MIFDSDSSQHHGEGFPRDMVICELPKSLRIIQNRLFRKGDPDTAGGWETVPDVIHGFEDVLGKTLGNGLYDNHTGTSYQLAFALAMSSNPAINEVVNDDQLTEPADIVKLLRERKVLDGMKIIDLGCGSASFAVAASALGASVYTADAFDLPPGTKAHLSGHVVINFGEENAPALLARETGGNFDLVTENICGEGAHKVQVIPREKFRPVIGRIASAILKSRGYLYGQKFGMGLNDVFVKK